MIWESSYWKEDLLRYARHLEGRAQQRRWSERSSARLEKTVMLGFYTLRKLFEAQKVSTAIAKAPIALTSYRWLGKPVTRMNWHRFLEKYDFEHPIKLQKQIGFVCDQLVHSYVFAPVTEDEGGLVSILFNSDRTRRKSLFELPLATVAHLFSSVGEDNPSAMQALFNPSSDDYDTWLVPSEALSRRRGQRTIAEATHR